MACGLLHLRIVDPEFKSPAAGEVALINLFFLLVILACLNLVYAPYSGVLAPESNHPGFPRYPIDIVHSNKDTKINRTIEILKTGYSPITYC